MRHREWSLHAGPRLRFRWQKYEVSFHVFADALGRSHGVESKLALTRQFVFAQGRLLGKALSTEINQLYQWIEHQAEKDVGFLPKEQIVAKFTELGVN